MAQFTSSPSGGPKWVTLGPDDWTCALIVVASCPVDNEAALQRDFIFGNGMEHDFHLQVLNAKAKLIRQAMLAYIVWYRCVDVDVQ